MKPWTIGWWVVAAGWQCVLLDGAYDGRINIGVFTVALFVTIMYAMISLAWAADPTSNS